MHFMFAEFDYITIHEKINRLIFHVLPIFHQFFKRLCKFVAIFLFQQYGLCELKGCYLVYESLELALVTFPDLKKFGKINGYENIFEYLDIIILSDSLIVVVLSNRMHMQSYFENYNHICFYKYTLSNQRFILDLEMWLLARFQTKH